MKKLPKLYKMEKIQTENNNTKYYRIKKENNIQNNDIRKQINAIFNMVEYSNNKKVLIKTKEKLYDTYLISRTRDNIITSENELIPIKDIIFIKEKN